MHLHIIHQENSLILLSRRTHQSWQTMLWEFWCFPCSWCSFSPQKVRLSILQPQVLPHLKTLQPQLPNPSTFPCMESLKEACILKNARAGAPRDARRQLTRSRACSSARSAAPSASACRRAPTETSSFVVAITAGRPRGGGPSAPDHQFIAIYSLVLKWEFQLFSSSLDSSAIF